jgi:hypothetical protein
LPHCFPSPPPLVHSNYLDDALGWKRDRKESILRIFFASDPSLVFHRPK